MMTVAGSVVEILTQIGSTLASIMFGYAMFRNYFPYEFHGPFKTFSQTLLNIINPYIHITFPEYTGDDFCRSSAFSSIERYLNTTSATQAKNLNATVAPDSDLIILTMAKNDEVTDVFEGLKLRWASTETPHNKKSISFYPQGDQRRNFRLTFHRPHREAVIARYLKHVLAHGKSITLKESRRRIYTNNNNDNDEGLLWSNVLFKHPATFETLAIDPSMKSDIINDITHFSKSKDYYQKIGKTWKRGYLLFGPPGTGKSTMIAAMANLLNYNIYDIELTSVKDNVQLRKLLIGTTRKSIIVIEDIDCSLKLTGQRKKKTKEEKDEDKTKEEEDEDSTGDDTKKKTNQVTLSGLLNFIDGLWSACGEERIIVFTTNYVEKLDPALIRRGRMDKHIELSYCGFEAFKVLANNYLGVESHQLFDTIREKLEETNMTPADVCENLMLKMGEDEGSCLLRLIEALDETEEAARVKAEEEVKLMSKKLVKEGEEEEEEKNED